MSRRTLVTCALLCASFILATFPSAGAQPARIPTIGVLSGDSPDDSPCVERLRRGLSDLGYHEGRTHLLELRWARGRTEMFPALAAELVGLKVDLIVSAAGTAAPAVKAATSTIPIVLASSFYPVETGVIASLARPGGNITGVTHFTPELMAKRVQLLKEAVPRISRIAVLRLPGHLQDLVVRDLEAAARQIGVQMQPVEIRTEDDLVAAFDAAVKGRADAVMTTQSPVFVHNNARIAQLALRHRLPSLSGEPGAAADGTLVFFGPNVFEGCSRAARYVDRILRGARPSDLPVEQPTKIELVINVKTAKTLGLTLPPSLLLRADQLLE